MSLFEEEKDIQTDRYEEVNSFMPLAARMRPETLEEVAG